MQKNAIVMINEPILCYNLPRQAFVLSGSRTSAYWNKGSARGDCKGFDNLKRLKKLILRNIYELKNAYFSVKKVWMLTSG